MGGVGDERSGVGTEVSCGVVAGSLGCPCKVLDVLSSMSSFSSLPIVTLASANFLDASLRLLVCFWRSASHRLSSLRCWSRSLNWVSSSMRSWDGSGWI